MRCVVKVHYDLRERECEGEERRGRKRERAVGELGSRRKGKKREEEHYDYSIICFAPWLTGWLFLCLPSLTHTLTAHGEAIRVVTFIHSLTYKPQQ